MSQASGNSKKKTNGLEFGTAIGKKVVESCFLGVNGFQGDQQADKKHHGGSDKAVLIFSATAYEIINKHFNSQLNYTSTAAFGEMQPWFWKWRIRWKRQGP